MRYSPPYTKIIILLILPILIIALTKCAQVVSPTGGKKDTLAPVLVTSIPANKTTNYKGNIIQLEFDEYIILDNIVQKLIITPEVDNPYTPQVNKNKLTLKFKKPLPDSTTYTFNFGQSVKDFAEKNPAINLKLVFSTGSKIDSGSVHGKVEDILTGKPLFNTLVGLYKLSDTLNPEKQKPYYFTRTDSSGLFSIENTIESKFSLIALTDNNNNLLYNPKSEKIAFRENPVNTSSDSLEYKLYLFSSNTSELKIQRTVPRVNTYTVQFNKGVEKLLVNFPGQDSLPYIRENAMDVKFYNIRQNTDTLVVNLNATDSLGQQFEASQKIAFQVQRSKQRQTDPFNYTTSTAKGNPLGKKIDYTITFNKPIKHYEYAAITVSPDSLHKKSIDNYSPKWNSTINQLSFSGTNPAKDTLKIRLPKGSIISVDNDTLPETILIHSLIKDEDYGIVDVKVAGNTKNIPIFIELLDKEFHIVQTLYKAPFIFKQIPQGEYHFRLIEDHNQNQKWDTGNFRKKQQPEPIHIAPVKLNVKSNFEYADTFFTLP